MTYCAFETPATAQEECLPTSSGQTVFATDPSHGSSYAEASSVHRRTDKRRCQHRADPLVCTLPPLAGDRSLQLGRSHSSPPRIFAALSTDNCIAQELRLEERISMAPKGKKAGKRKPADDDDFWCALLSPRPPVPLVPLIADPALPKQGHARTQERRRDSRCCRFRR